MLDGLKHTLLVFAADRRLSKADGSYGGMARKLFRIPYLDSAVSYFGLATVYPRDKQHLLSEWLKDFIVRHNSMSCLRDFTYKLRDTLNDVVPRRILEKCPSGFHVCGYNSNGLPEFWRFSNIGRVSDFAYHDLQTQYGEPREDFLGRDARRLGWDGQNLGSVRNSVQIYRNGDFKAHVFFWERLDGILVDMQKFQDIKKVETVEDYARWVKFKFEVIAYFYKRLAKRPVIGRPVDVVCATRRL